MPRIRAGIPQHRRNALENPRFACVIDEHQNSYGIPCDVAHKDPLYMADELKLLTKIRGGKRYRINDTRQRAH